MPARALSTVLDPLLVAGMWLLFSGYWLVAARGAKRSADARAVRGQIGVRLTLLVLIAAVLQARPLRVALLALHRWTGPSRILGIIGVLLCLLGFALAVSARHHLGRNWGLPMSRKQDPELVTSGPYAYIRHPIYTGLLLALLGSALAVSLFWALLLVLAGGYFLYSARREEALLSEQFPEQYAAYRSRTGMLLPCPLRSH